MNNGINSKLVGIELLKKTQVLYQNKAISTEEKNAIASYIKEGMATGMFYKLNKKLFDILETIALPQIVEDMLALTT